MAASDWVNQWRAEAEGAPLLRLPKVRPSCASCNSSTAAGSMRAASEASQRRTTRPRVRRGGAGLNVLSVSLRPTPRPSASRAMRARARLLYGRPVRVDRSWMARFEVLSNAVRAPLEPLLPSSNGVRPAVPGSPAGA
jgi:hypothetical protein